MSSMLSLIRTSRPKNIYIYIYTYFKDPSTNILIFRTTKRKTDCSRVIGERCLEMLRKSFKVMAKFLELGVGHSAANRWKTHGVGSILKAAVTAWRRAARRPPESRGKMSLALETTVAEHQRFDAAPTVTSPYWFLRGGRRASDDFPPPGNRTATLKRLSQHTYTGCPI